MSLPQGWEESQKQWQKNMNEFADDMQQEREEKEKQDKFRFWLPVWISIIALIISALALFLQIWG